MRVHLLFFACMLVHMAFGAAFAGPRDDGQPVVLAHYMPWFAAKPQSPQWGWHWTMNHFDPERVDSDGRRSIASHFYPRIGPYDSGDAAVLEYHLLSMRLAGIDGVIVDWYGLTDFRDYAVLHRNTTRLLEQAERLGMKFVICYEDQTIPALVEAGRLAASGRVAHATGEIEWLGKYWFKSASYLLHEGRPVMLSFGHDGLTSEEWSQCIEQLSFPVAYFSQSQRRPGAIGGFDWPVPADPVGTMRRFQQAMHEWPAVIPVAYPRFVDIYAEAGVSDSYGRLADDQGRSFRQMLRQALASRASIIQLATWNDWGEGTMIEPSQEFGLRDLEAVQTLIAADSGFTAADLELPYRLYEARRAAAADPERLDEIALLLATGRASMAKDALDEVGSHR
jgi:hypothetical protein